MQKFHVASLFVLDFACRNIAFLLLKHKYSIQSHIQTLLERCHLLQFYSTRVISLWSEATHREYSQKKKGHTPLRKLDECN